MTIFIPLFFKSSAIAERQDLLCLQEIMKRQVVLSAEDVSPFVMRGSKA